MQPKSYRGVRTKNVKLKNREFVFPPEKTVECPLKTPSPPPSHDPVGHMTPSPPQRKKHTKKKKKKKKKKKAVEMWPEPVCLNEGDLTVWCCVCWQPETLTIPNSTQVMLRSGDTQTNGNFRAIRYLEPGLVSFTSSTSTRDALNPGLGFWFGWILSFLTGFWFLLNLRILFPGNRTLRLHSARYAGRRSDGAVDYGKVFT